MSKAEISIIAFIGAAISAFICLIIWANSGYSGAGNDKTPMASYKTIIIEDCEYIFISRRPYGSDMSLSHKGNCKNHGDSK